MSPCPPPPPPRFAPMVGPPYEIYLMYFYITFECMFHVPSFAILCMKINWPFKSVMIITLTNE